MLCREVIIKYKNIVYIYSSKWYNKLLETINKRDGYEGKNINKK